MNIALLTAAGTGNRMQQQTPKQFMHVNDKPLIIYSMEAFQKVPEIDVIAVVCLEGWEAILQAYAEQFGITKLKHIFPGAESGQASIRSGLKGLEAFYPKDSLILVHDGVRPLVSQDIILDNIVVAEKYGNAIASIPTIEAMLYSEDTQASERYFDREFLQRTQTPHAFRLGELLEMHDMAEEKGIENSVASCTLAIDLGKTVHFSLGSEKNFKITHQDDIDIFKALLMLKNKEV
ncbi:IspD/TarI family cytidylyltransferase [Lactococcus termiticola]|uniref:2-C-methyl-D-erythritol 4-phosphate cytidylyltransferase n=1 Tax=Lactococcus termiticola TaxID=2169526 RepID=A0A2R5HH04_9LACT|nr:IspD/TarI family cytidylyltransferase [Lactococcus termiticola]GBG97262.1 2-C-methyl-D-erythritol 4-phosphate cytidylyltransferase [Lactococcus termiticola]